VARSPGYAFDDWLVSQRRASEGRSVDETHKELRRQAILDAAEYLFARLEYADVRLDDVARRASVAKGTLYLYFDNKLDLFLSTVERKLQRIRDLFLSTLKENPDPVTAVRLVIRAELAFLREHAEFFRAYYPQVLNMRLRTGAVADEVKRRILPIMCTIMDAFASRIREGQESGVFRPANPCRLAFLLGALLREAAILSASGVDEELVCRPDVLESLFLEGLLAR
jgi:TetR/AcrR family fatty acid metabolism transcriptional regulator